MPSLLRPRRKPPRADDDGAATRALTCALAGMSNLLVFAFVSLLGTLELTTGQSLKRAPNLHRGHVSLSGFAISTSQPIHSTNNPTASHHTTQAPFIRPSPFNT